MPFLLQNEARGRTVGLCVDKQWGVDVGCEKGHAVYWSPSALSEKFDRGVTLEAIAARLACATCGSRSGGVGIRQDTSGDARQAMMRKEPGPPGFYRPSGA